MQQLLIKYRENNCSSQELDQVLAYLKTDAGQQHLAKLLDSEPTLSSSSAPDTDYDRVFDWINERIARKPPQPTAKEAFIGRRWFSAVAAAVAFLLLAATTWLLIQGANPTTYQTAYGETQVVALPDGSVVTLNAHSRLTLSDDFDARREVWLKGEAFFEVEKARDEARNPIKFVVHTGRLRVEVLGTSFNVQDWDEKTQVVLESGKVKLTSATHEAVTMEPGELAEVTNASQAIQKKAVNPDRYSAWTESRLRCDDTPLQEIATVIERRFGKRVIFEQEKLRKITVTGTMPLHKLTLLTEVLEASLPVAIQVDEETLIIRERNPVVP